MYAMMLLRSRGAGFRVCVLCVFLCSCALLRAQSASDPGWKFTKWVHSYKAGHKDKNGHYMGGSQMMHLVPYKGKLFAGLSYWQDSRNYMYGSGDRRIGWGQILRLDSAKGKWEVDYEMGPYWLRPETLKVVTFRTDKKGRRLTRPVTFMLTCNYAGSGGNVTVHSFTRNDKNGKWEEAKIYTAPRAGHEAFSVRAILVHRDKVTGIDRAFLTIGTRGIISGVYDPSVKGDIRWDKQLEKGPLPIRPLAIVEANGDLFFPTGHYIFRRIDGPKPSYEPILDMTDIDPGKVESPVGGIRGLTTIANPNGKGDSMIFLWSPRGGMFRGDIYRLDREAANRYSRHKEVAIADVISKHLGGTPVYFVLGAYNAFMPIRFAGETEHIFGFETVIKHGRHSHFQPNPNGKSSYYRGGMFAIRSKDQTYRIAEVKGKGGTKQCEFPLVATVAYAVSPFRNEKAVYFCGLDPNSQDSTNYAWIYKGFVNGVVKGGRAPREKRRSNPGVAVANQSYRTWTSSKGSTIEAKLVGAAAETVVLRKRNGKRIRVKKASLATADQLYLSSVL